MKFNNIVTNRIKLAKQKLNDHRNLGTKSRLSIEQVAELHDIVNGGNSMVPEGETGLFYGLHSLN